MNMGSIISRVPTRSDRTVLKLGSFYEFRIWILENYSWKSDFYVATIRRPTKPLSVFSFPSYISIIKLLISSAYKVQTKVQYIRAIPLINTANDSIESIGFEIVMRYLECWTQKSLYVIVSQRNSLYQRLSRNCCLTLSI